MFDHRSINILAASIPDQFFQTKFQSISEVEACCNHLSKVPRLIWYLACKKPPTFTEEGVICTIEKGMASTFAMDIIYICLLASKRSEKCEDKKAASLSDLNIFASKSKRACRR